MKIARMLLLGAVLSAPSIAAAETAPAPSAPTGNPRQAMIERVGALVARGGAADLATAAMYWRVSAGPPSEGQIAANDLPPVATLMDRATALAPQDPRIAWVALLLRCADLPAACASAEELERLRVADPDNLVPWFLEIRRAETSGDRRAVDEALVRAADAKHAVDPFWPIMRMAASAFRSLPPAAPEVTGVAGRDADERHLFESVTLAERRVSGLFRAAGVPQSMPEHLCEPGSGDRLSPATEDACRRIAERLWATGDSMGLLADGVTLLRNLSAADDVEMVAERRRELDYYDHAHLDLVVEIPIPGPAQATRQLAAPDGMSFLRGEMRLAGWSERLPEPLRKMDPPASGGPEH